MEHGWGVRGPVRPVREGLAGPGRSGSEMFETSFPRCVETGQAGAGRPLEAPSHWWW